MPSPSPAPGAAAAPAGADADRERAGPVPVARLDVTAVWIDGEETRLATIRLDFDYGGALVPAAGGAGPVVRDRAAELRARHLLESMGAIELACLDDVAGADQVDYAVRLDRDVHALCGFSAHVVPQLRALGWRVELAPDYPWQTVEPGAPLHAELSPGDRPDWFDLELGVDVDGHRVDVLPALLDLLDGASSLDALARTPRRCIAIPVGERRYLTVPPERLRLVLTVLRELYQGGERRRVPVPVCRAPVLAELGAALHDPVRPVRWSGATRIRDLGYDLALGPRPAPAAAAEVAPAGLHARLRPYQAEGVAWLQHLGRCGAGGVLADDMGLGKTLQAIAHLLIEKQAGRMDRPCLVVTLTSVVGNWRRELARFAPGLRVVDLTGAGRAARLARLDAADVAITTYPLVWRDREALTRHRYHVVILDEAHAIKNPDGLAHEAVRALDAGTRIALSGTPIENHLGELWAVMDLVDPGLLGSAEQFRSHFRVPIEVHGQGARLDVLRERVRPYILRRTKDAVVRELPPKTEIVRAVELDGAQRELYEGIRVAAHGEVRAHIRSRGIGGSQIAILDALLKLRQVCCDPRLVAVDAARTVTESAKYQLFLELVEQQLGAGRRLLVFSQFARMLALLSEGLLGRGIRHLTLTGATADRQRVIDQFERGAADVFLISLKAGGTGLNLTSADTVVHYDPWWNPAARAQATDRAYRIGQTRPVFAFSLIAAGSVEERMLALQERKRRLADAILGGGSSAATGLSEIDVEHLLAPLAT